MTKFFYNKMFIIFAHIKQLKPSKMTHLLKTLEKTPFDISIDTWSDNVYVKNKNGNYFFGFVVNYDIVRYEEKYKENFKTIMTGITDIEFYNYGEFIELDDDTHSKVIEILEKKVESQIN